MDRNGIYKIINHLKRKDGKIEEQNDREFLKDFTYGTFLYKIFNFL